MLEMWLNMAQVAIVLGVLLCGLGVMLCALGLADLRAARALHARLPASMYGACFTTYAEGYRFCEREIFGDDGDKASADQITAGWYASKSKAQIDVETNT